MLFEFYKIKNPDKEEFSAGLRNGLLQTSKKGKTFNSIGFVKTHISQVMRHNKRAFLWYDNWDVLYITESSVKIIGKVKDYKSE